MIRKRHEQKSIVLREYKKMFRYIYVREREREKIEKQNREFPSWLSG